MGWVWVGLLHNFRFRVFGPLSPKKNKISRIHRSMSLPAASYEIIGTRSVPRIMMMMTAPRAWLGAGYIFEAPKNSSPVLQRNRTACMRCFAGGKRICRTQLCIHTRMHVTGSVYLISLFLRYHVTSFQSVLDEVGRATSEPMGEVDCLLEIRHNLMTSPNPYP